MNFNCFKNERMEKKMVEKENNYVHIVRIYQGPTKTNTAYYNLSDCKLIGILKIDKENASVFWRNIINAGSNFFIEGSFYDYYNEKENRTWGDGNDICCIKYIGKNSLFIKTLLLPKKSTFYPENWAKEKIIENRKKSDVRKNLINLFHYELRLMNKIGKTDISKKYDITIPRQLFKEDFDKLSRIIRLIPSAIMTIDPFYGTININIDSKAMKNFCGLYERKK